MFRKTINKLLKTKNIDEQVESKLSDLLELKEKIKTLELSINEKEIEIKQAKQFSNHALAELEHQKKLELQEREAKFQREKTLWNEDKKRLETSIQEQLKTAEEQLQSRFEIKEQETISLVKLDAEQKTKQLEINNERAINELKSKHSEEVLKLKADHCKDLMEVEKKLSEEYYGKLKKALNDLHTKGNITTDFLKEMTLKMLDRAPALQATEFKVGLPRGDNEGQ
jgi:hypothetical protein